MNNSDIDLERDIGEQSLVAKPRGNSMKKHYKAFVLATVVTALTSGTAFNAFAQPPVVLPTYVEIVEFRNVTGAVIGVKYISHGCADPQPLGWGVQSGRGAIIATQICFAIGPGPGGPW